MHISGSNETQKRSRSYERFLRSCRTNVLASNSKYKDTLSVSLVEKKKKHTHTHVYIYFLCFQRIFGWILDVMLSERWSSFGTISAPGEVRSSLLCLLLRWEEMDESKPKPEHGSRYSDLDLSLEKFIQAPEQQPSKRTLFLYSLRRLDTFGVRYLIWGLKKGWRVKVTLERVERNLLKLWIY